MSVQTGLDRLIADDFAPIQAKRVGLLTNYAAIDAQITSAFTALRAGERAGHFVLAALFAPEHGIDAAIRAGELVETIEQHGVIVHSLYGKARIPTPEMLAPLDVIVCDLQDVGARFYTYVSSVSLMLEAAITAGKPVIVLDRPNPIGGQIIEHAPLDPALASFVGRFNIPVRHGLTLGELALLINERFLSARVDLTVIACDGWRRSMLWGDTGRLFAPPSPNIPTWETALHYPGSCLIEGTTLSEGRGTTLPFQVVGAPYINSEKLAEALNLLETPGVRFRPHTFQPCASKHEGVLCRGVQAHITDVSAYRPLKTWMQVIHTIRTHYPADFGWLPTADGEAQHFDRLIGSRAVRPRIDAGADLTDLFADWDAAARDFDAMRWSFLLYM